MMDLLLLGLLPFMKNMEASFLLFLLIVKVAASLFYNIQWDLSSGSPDSLSGFLYFICLYFTLIILLYSHSKGSDTLVKTFLLILGMLCVTFNTTSFLVFYFGFESCLIPLVLVILSEGSKKQRWDGAIFLTMYTVVFSFPLFLSILWSSKSHGSDDMFLLNTLSLPMSGWAAFGASLGVMSKIPVFGLHSWLPKAHVQAPLQGSIALAAILLKLGTYGMLRIVSLLEKEKIFFLKFFLCPWMVLGGVFISLFCFLQTDTKKLVAYSSVLHMAMCVFLTISASGEMAAASLGMMITHAFTSSSLFCLVTFFSYRQGSRNLKITKSLSKNLQSFYFILFYFILLNMSAPPSLNLLTELLSLFYLSSISPLLLGGGLLFVFFGGGYSFQLFTILTTGNKKNGSFAPASFLEILVLFSLFSPFIMIPLMKNFMFFI